MQRLALVLATGSVLAAALPAPGLYLALGLGLGAVGTGWVGYADRGAPGFPRLGAAAAVTLGGIGVLLGAVRVVLALTAIGHVERLIG
jgi:hypothetical protein